MTLASLGVPIVSLTVLALAETCAGASRAPDAGMPRDDGPRGAVPLTVDYAAAGIYGAPWPDERLRRPDGTLDLSGFPNGLRNTVVTRILATLEDADGFGRSSAVFVPLPTAADPGQVAALTAHRSLDPDAEVAMVDVDPASPDRGARHPVEVAFEADPGPFGVPNLLSLLPVQGRPLAPGRLYAAVVTGDLRAADGRAFGPAPATLDLLAGRRPDGLGERAFDAHQTAIEGLADAGIPLPSVAALAVFRTGDPEAGLRRAGAQLAEVEPPRVEPAFTPREVFGDYCVFESRVVMPVFQAGEPPYTEAGGGWVRDDEGRLVEQRRADSTVWVTVPRRPMPASGYPMVLFVRTGGGGDRPLVDRGRRSTERGPADQPGTGPALRFARAGFAAISVDGPLGGLRNPDGWDEQFAIFNILNPLALRDTIRQSALELILVARGLDALEVDASSCPEVVAPGGVVRFDPSRLVLMGHSMGATIGPLAVALEPAFRGAILSGAGGSWIANVMYKLRPLEVRSAAEALLTYSVEGRSLTEADPVLSLLQWAGEPADPQLYAARIVVGDDPRHVLMFQGILDTFIPPPVANALSLSLEVDLVAPALDERLDGYPPFGSLRSLAGLRQLPAPVSANKRGVTAVLVQHAEDGVLDGHEVVFQRDEAGEQITCFLRTLGDGTPEVPGPGGCE